MKGIKRFATYVLAYIILLFGMMAALPPEVANAMSGSGTEEDPFIITDVNELQDMENDLTAYYELGNDIDASATSGWNDGEGFNPISAFEGYFDGKNYTISDLTINRVENHQGLFGSCDSATIINVILSDVNITGSGYSGAITGVHPDIPGATGDVIVAYLVIEADGYSSRIPEFTIKVIDLVDSLGESIEVKDKQKELTAK